MIPELDTFLASLADLGRTMDRLGRALARAADPKLRPRRWTAADQKQLRARYPHEATAKLAKALSRPLASVYGQAHKLKLCKSAAFLASPASGRTTGRQGVGSRFRKGFVPWNKGRKGCPPGSAKGWFKKGAKPLNTWKPIGTETVTKDGYLVRKVTDVGGYNNDDWKFVHHLVWEKHTGRRVPPGHALIFKNGNKRDFAISNLELVTRGQLMKKNSIHNYPEPIKDLIRWGGVLTRAINKRKRNEDDQRPA